jgi:hypothetical protein
LPSASFIRRTRRSKSSPVGGVVSVVGVGVGIGVVVGACFDVRVIVVVGVVDVSVVDVCGSRSATNDGGTIDVNECVTVVSLLRRLRKTVVGASGASDIDAADR